MMKRTYDILVAFCLIAVSCSQNELQNDGYTTIQATFPDYIDSKVTIDEKYDDKGLSLSWQKSDKLVVVGESVETYTLASIDGKKATFTGKVVKGNMFDVILSDTDDYENRSYQLQQQTGVFSTSHLGYDACLKGVKSYTDVKFTQEWADENGGELLQSGCLLLYFQLPVKASNVSQVKIEASSPIFFSTNSESSVMSASMVMNIEKGIVGAENTVKAYMMTSMHETVIPDGTTLRISVGTEKGIYCKDIVPGQVSILPGKRNVIKLNSKNWKPVMEYKNYTFMTYNVGKFEKFKDELGHYSYPEAASIINHYGVDIVGLNEIECTRVLNIDLNNQPKILAAEIGTGWNHHFFPAKDDDYGNAVVSSPELKAISTSKIDLPCVTEGYQTRALGIVEYEDFIFCVTHLDHHNRTNRAPQIVQINNWIQTNYGNSEKPIILVGDMNATPGSPEINGFSAEFEGLGVYWNTISVIGTKPNYVVTFPDHGSCLDYIFLWKNDAIDYTVNISEVVSAFSEFDVSLVSDHYPVYTDITFKKKYAVDDIKDQTQVGVDRFPDSSIYEENF